MPGRSSTVAKWTATLRTVGLPALVLAPMLLLAPGCAGNRAYLDWRPGLTAFDFEGLFEIPIDEYERYVEEHAANLSYERSRGNPSSDAAAAMVSLGDTLAAGPNTDLSGHAIVELSGEGVVTLTGERDTTSSGTIEWFATTPDREWSALLLDTTLAVAIDDGTAAASTGIDVGSLLGASPAARGIGGYQWLMFERDGELSVFALPELGGAVTANELGFLFAFQYTPGSRETWSISVARVTVVL